jgi:hypothetical protein
MKRIITFILSEKVTDISGFKCIGIRGLLPELCDVNEVFSNIKQLV